MIGRIWMATTILIVICYGSGAAQTTSFEFVPHGGVFVPTGELGTAEIEAATYEIRQNPSAVFGSRLVAWWSPVVGWEGNFAYALSDGELKTSAGEDFCAIRGAKCRADVWFASSKLVFRYVPRQYTGWYVFAGAGVAVVGHVGDLWEQADATTDLGGVLGIGGVIDISPTFAVRIDAEDYLYKYAPKLRLDPELGTFTGSSRLQHDLVFSAGLIIRLADK